MPRAPKRLTPEQEFLIYELRKAGKSGGEVEKICARGYKEHPPFSVSPTHARDVGRKIMDERGELYSSELATAPPSEALEKLARRLLHVADRESARLDRLQRAGRLDGDKVARLATALTRLHTLHERLEKARAGAGDGEQPGGEGKGPDADGRQQGSAWIAGAVSANGEAEQPEPAPPPEPLADRKLPPDPSAT